ncbi:hypothetical protein ACETU7_34755 [Rhodococcus sp. 3Y1]
MEQERPKRTRTARTTSGTWIRCVVMLLRRLVRSVLLEWSNPEPSLLWTLAGTVRMWERQITDSDYCHVRVGLGTQRLATRLVSPETGPVEDLEPVAAVSLRRFVRAHSVVQDLPTAVSLRGFAAMSIEGQRDSARALVRSMLMQLCIPRSGHAPSCGGVRSRYRIRVGVGQVAPPRATPAVSGRHRHCTHGVRFVSRIRKFPREPLSMRARFARNTPASAGVPHLVLVVDGGLLEGDTGLLSNSGSTR